MPPGNAQQTVDLQTLVAAIQNAVQAQNLIATNIAKLTTAFNTAFPPPLTGSAAWTPGLIANGATAILSLTVTGAALGKFVRAAFNLDLQGCTISGYVSAANTVKVVITNNTGGNITLGAGTANVSVAS